MFKFHLKRNAKDILGNIILICIPIILIYFFYYIYSNNLINTGAVNDSISLNVSLTIGFALTFQIYGAALSFETLAQDFLNPMHDRLLASPTEPRRIITSVLFSSTLVSFAQTVVIVVFSMITLGVKFNNLFAVLLVLFLSVIVNQLIGTTILLSTKKVRTANAITTLYGVIAPFLAGLYFPLPSHSILNFMKKYLTPMSLAQTGISGIINHDYKSIVVGVLPLLLIVVILFAFIKPLSKKVIL